jgi:hypothetical protein
MDERFHKKDDKCDQGDYDKKRFSFFIIYKDWIIINNHQIGNPGRQLYCEVLR